MDLAKRCVWTTLASFLLFPTAALAQNKPSSPPGQTKKPRPRLPPGSGGSGKGTAGRTELPVPAPGGGTGSPTSAIVLASWLDDAETLPPGAATFSMSIGRAESLDGGETDAPFDAAVGIAKRVQLSVSLPYYWASYNDGYEASGRGNTYLAGKVQILDPHAHTVGLAAAPVLEILSDASVSDPTLGLSRVNWALPVSVQAAIGEARVFGTAGYFSRGAVFLAAALEHSAGARTTLTGALSFMHTTSRSDASDLAGLASSRLDATLSVAVRLTPTLSAFGAVGRTISSLDQNGAKLLASAGISYSYKPIPKPRP